ncbi:hypothetical protein CLV31_106195 [Algoriphagus aquaeductus]|uniref:Outer membrane protein with beta-barrel domain n=1 Tax=Algoriphagus aquaeductus TaxID=475299 RepID=A0A326RUT5_9BACT|nr:hypothetical protein [Algoriphagus aquaeductus]PZV83578.1 hypothetical protein CLV31_106195 [Algoriphagus aquaeductus]
MKSIFLTLIFFSVGWAAQAQFFIAGGHFNGGIANGRLNHETGGLFFPTLSGIILHEERTAPIQLGIELGYGIYGSKLERRTDLYEGFSDELRLRRNNNIATGMLVMRYILRPQGKVMPFVEAKFGANYLYTRYKIRESILSEETLEAGKDREDWSVSYSFGTGVQIPIPSSPGLVFEFKANYQTGPSAEFLTKGDATFNPLPNGGGTFDYQVRRSPLEMVTLSVGFLVYDVFR